MPTTIPTLHTSQLVLRPFAESDGPRVQKLAGAWEIAHTAAHIPHPYPDGAAEEWISTHAAQAEKGKCVTLAVCLAEGTLIGAISLMNIQSDQRHAELGYWIGKDYWGQGYCTQAGQAILRYGFERLHLHRIYAEHMTRNPASGRVMEKLGMTHEGKLRQHLLHHGKTFEDLECWGILQPEWAAMS